MWLSNSSVGRKVVMSVTGIALVLFLTFHMAMNLVGSKLVCVGSYAGPGCPLRDSHYLRFLADNTESRSTW